MNTHGFKRSSIQTFINLSVLAFLNLFILSLPSCHQRTVDNERDVLQQIQDSGELVALTLYSSTSYFMYRGQDMGFQYDLANQFAKSLGVKLRIEVANNVNELVNKLNKGEGDLIAFNLPVTKDLKDSVLYCGNDVVTHQVIVQRIGNRRNPSLNDVTELVGKEVHVKPGIFYERLSNLNEELGGGIDIRLIDNDSITEEDLIRQVAEGKIDYTVSDNDVAQLNRTYYPRLDIDLAISFDQRSSWAVRKADTLLAKAADEWQKQNITSPTYTSIMKRYFEGNKEVVVHAPILSEKEGKISEYDNLFKKYAPTINWDWRLLASVAFKESRFDTTAVSWSGARGLMQLMPVTAKAMGMPDGMEENAEESVKAAVKLIGVLSESFKGVSDEQERIKFTLAAYNSGLAHILDARALAEKYGADKNIWYDNAEKYLLLKSNEQYFNDPVCKAGYFRGIETYNFVREILERLEIYKEKIPL